MKNVILTRLNNIGIIPVVRIDDLEDSLPLAHALLKGGLDCAEITFRSAHAAAAIEAISKNVPELLVGAGTVLTIEQAEAAVQAGASFIVTPGFNPAVVRWCQQQNILIIPGVSTATEIEMALQEGITTVKFFPAESSGGAKKIKALSAPYSKLSFIPTGGIDAANMHDYLSLPCVEAIGGSFMLPQEALAAKDWEHIEQLTQQAVSALLGYRMIHLGINSENKEEALKTAETLAALFHFQRYTKPKSIFASVSFEVMHGKGPGQHGHIGIFTPYPEKAIYQLNKQGIKIKEETITRNKKTNRINFAYLDLEVAGFGIHLINPDVKMV